MWSSFVILKQLPKVKKEKSPNLVTLLATLTDFWQPRL
jgi:hypothetical protein